MRTARFLTIIALTVGVVSLFSCTKETEYQNGTGLPTLTASDSVNPSIINTSHLDVFFKVFSTETDFIANSNPVFAGMILKGKQLSFKTLKGGTGDSLSYVIEWFTADGSVSNWLNAPENRVFKIAKTNGVQSFSVDTTGADSSHLVVLGASGDSSLWVTTNYFDSTTNNDNVDTARTIKLFRNFTGNVTKITKSGSTFGTSTEDITYKVNVAGKKVTVSLYKNGNYYGYLVNHRFNLTSPIDTVYRSNQAKAKFVGNNRQYSLSRSN